MIEKVRLVLKTLYIALIVPSVTTCLLSQLYFHSLFYNKQYYYTNQCSSIIIVISLILVISSYLISNKKFYEVIYYLIGITIGLLSKLLPLGGASVMLQTFILQCILIIGYTVLIFILLLSKKYKIQFRIYKIAKKNES